MATIHCAGDSLGQRLVSVLTSAAIDALEWLCEGTNPHDLGDVDDPGTLVS